jgi:hypothetical protein
MVQRRCRGRWIGSVLVRRLSRIRWSKQRSNASIPKDDYTLLCWRVSILEAVGIADAIDKKWRIHLTVCRGSNGETAGAVEEAMGEALPLDCEVRGLAPHPDARRFSGDSAAALSERWHSTHKQLDRAIRFQQENPII